MLHAIILITSFLSFALGQNNPRASTKYGQVEGSTIRLSDGNTVHTYLGVPYAKPPVGNLRFRDTQEPDSWSGVRMAKSYGPSCPQPEGGAWLLTHPGYDNFNEDCLYLNIHVPGNSTGPHGVLVWFHGGAYRTGGAIQYPGHFLAGWKNVVVVTAHYRLGALGFMYTGDDAAPGNAGLFDVIQVLRFVKENIGNFNGDPNKVTMFGQSAGAGAIGNVMLSPLAAGLVDQAIFQSGTEMNAWAVNDPKSYPEEYYKQAAQQLDCPITSSQAAIDCLRTKPFSSFSNMTINCTEGWICLGMVPVVDGRLLPDTPRNLRAAGRLNKIPIMSGHLTEDGSVYLISLPGGDNPGGYNRTFFNDALAYWFNYLSQGILQPNRSANDVIQATNRFYTPWPEVNDMEANRQALSDLVTDVGFGAPEDHRNKDHSRHAPVYHFLYGYMPTNLGVFHLLELPSVFGHPYLPLNQEVMNQTDFVNVIEWTDTDRSFANYIMTLWANFANTGNPTPTPVMSPNGGPITWPQFHYRDGADPDLPLMFVSNNETSIHRNHRQLAFAFIEDYLHYMGFSQPPTFTPPRP